MRLSLRAALVGGGLTALAGFAIGQSLTSQTLTGNEVVVAAIGGPGGPSLFVPTSQLRNALAIKTFSGAGTPTYQALPTDSTLYWTGAAPTSWTITTPVAPWDGQVLTIDTDTTLTTMVTLTPATGQTLTAAFSAATVTAITPVSWQFVASLSKWERIK